MLNLGKTTTTLLAQEGTLIQLETPVFLHLVETHVIEAKDPSQSSDQDLSAEVHRLLMEAGDKAIEVANERHRLMEAYQNKLREVYAGTPTRTIRDWLAHFRDAEAAYGYGYVGLLPKTAARGNRNPKADEAARRFLDDAIAQWYARPKQQKARDVFVLYQRACEQGHAEALSGAVESLHWFADMRGRYHEIVTLLHAAIQQFSPSPPQSTSRHSAAYRHG